VATIGNSRTVSARAAAVTAGVIAVLVGAGVVTSGAPDEGTDKPAVPFFQLPGQDRPLPAQSQQGGQDSYVVAEAKGPAVGVHPAPDPTTRATELKNPNEVGAPRVFLALKAEGDWLKVQVPVRPNATTGWIKRSDVNLKSTPFRIHVDLSDRQLSVYKANELYMREPVGVGKSVTATPKGLYFVTELLKPPNPRGPYGPYAFGTSAFSDVLTDFQGGNGVIGIHGTNDPSGLGKDVSHGCIRLGNDAITRLAGVLPLGSPVYITE
jgi:lipoprotein-anchoring transpeptidase ErfK/SrfK